MSNQERTFDGPEPTIENMLALIHRDGGHYLDEHGIRKAFDDASDIVCRNHHEEHRACPCLHTTPCHPHCTCVNPHMSRGCRRCCSYGSKEQQHRMAVILAARIERQEPGDPDVAPLSNEEIKSRALELGKHSGISPVSMSQALMGLPGAKERAVNDAIKQLFDENRMILNGQFRLQTTEIMDIREVMRRYAEYDKAVADSHNREGQVGWHERLLALKDIRKLAEDALDLWRDQNPGKHYANEVEKLEKEDK